MFGISAISDQQMAGLVMKLGRDGVPLVVDHGPPSSSGRHATRRPSAEGRSVTERDLLTWDQVATELDALGPAPKETEVD